MSKKEIEEKNETAVKNYECKIEWGKNLDSLTVSDRVNIAASGLNTHPIIDLLTDDTPTVKITVKAFAVCRVHNERAKDQKEKDYTSIFFFAADGNVYSTSSAAVLNSLDQIYDAMADMGVPETETIDLVFYGRESKNYKGKMVLLCKMG